MAGCGGPLSQAGWIAHLADQLAVAEPTPADLSLLADLFGGDGIRARQFIAGLQVSRASLLDFPAVHIWRPESRQRRAPDYGLVVFAQTLNPSPADPGPRRADGPQRVSASRAGDMEQRLEPGSGLSGKHAPTVRSAHAHAISVLAS
jgi:hypothetical protein